MSAKKYAIVGVKSPAAEGQGAGTKSTKRVTFNPVVEYFYYNELDTTPEELKRLDSKHVPEGRLVSVQNLNSIYGL